MLLKIILALALLAAILLPLNLLTSQPLHHDEALYATWALQVVSGRDPWLAQTPVDKPPLFPYVLAGFMKLLGVSPTITRLPSLLATVAGVGLTFLLGRKLYGAGAGLLAAWLTALSPFTILFAPTAFTDPLLATLVLAGCLAAVYGRAGWAGVCLGLAIATKQQGVFFVPLALLMINRQGSTIKGQPTPASLRPSNRTDGRVLLQPDAFHATVHQARAGLIPRLISSLPHGVPFRPSLYFFLALGLTLLPVLIWDLSRSQTNEFLKQSLVNYGGLSGDIASFSRRWWGFMDLLQYGTASPVLNLIFLAGLPLLLLYDLWWPSDGKKSPIIPPARLSILHVPVDWILALFTLLFVLGHALFSFQVWDRYLLGLIPFLALLLARILLLPWRAAKDLWLNRQPERLRPAGLGMGLVLAVVLALAMAGPVQDTVNGRYPLGSHSQALQGIEQIVAYLQGQAGANHTLYHRWLGTHWRFYLWGYPYDLQYWGSPEELAAKAQPGHLIAIPAWRSDTEARLALAAAGLTMQELSRAYHPAGYPSIILYRIEATAR